MGDTEGISVEETNKIRAQLGLKPLRVGPPKETKPDDEEKLEVERKQREQEARNAEVAARLEKVKNKRAITAKIQGSALGEELANDAELDDAAAWVARQKQRKVEEAATAVRPAKRERRDDSHKYDEKDLKDMKVGHKFDSIADGETLILTLADAPVLDSKTRTMNDADDVLENVSIRDKERHAKIEEEKKRIKSGRVYDPYAENKSILSQYDEEEERVTFSLSTTVAEAPSRDEVKARLAAMPTVSLSGDKVVASEYLTVEEAKFRAPKAKKIVRKKKTSSLVKELEEAASVEHSASAAAQEPAPGDHGSRGEVSASREADEAASKAERIRMQRENYERAQQKATAASATLLPLDPKKKLAVAPVPVKKEKKEDNMFQDDAEEEMLAAVNAARAKNQVIKPADIAEQVLARRAMKKEDEEQKDPFAASQSADVTFSSTTEFLRAVQAPTLASSNAQSAAAKSAAAAAKAASAAEAQAMDLDEAVKVEDPEAMGERVEVEDGEDKAGDDSSEDGPAMPAEPQVGRSMAAALQYVQSRASGLEKDLEVYSGRKSDKPIRPQEQGPGEVRLMYVDEFGAQMTPKEAWRHMCHAFHGKHPSKNKREKMLKRREAMLAAKREGGTADLVGQVDTMIKTQAKLQSPFIVVSSSTPAPLIAAALAAKKEPAPSGPVKMEAFSLKPKHAKK